MNEKARNSVLYLDGVSVSFDGFKALNELSLVVEAGEMRAIIGPNGAGKTTMMDVVTGKTKPDSGEIYFDGAVDLTRMDEASIAQLGIGRKFQKPTVFENLSVLDNLDLALIGRRGPGQALFGREAPSARERLEELLSIIRLGSQRHRKAGSLSHGQKQWLEIGMLLAQEPKLLLVDEPAAGMTDAETAATAELLREIAKTKSVIVVEHDMTFVRALDVKVTVLNEGSVLSEGTLDHVSADPRVIESLPRAVTMADGINRGASFEASLREAPRDEESRDSHLRSRRSFPSLILRGEGSARASKDAPSRFPEFSMPPVERPVFDLPLPASRWRWRG